jgi:hypothetical protein
MPRYTPLDVCLVRARLDEHRSVAANEPTLRIKTRKDRDLGMIGDGASTPGVSGAGHRRDRRRRRRRRLGVCPGSGRAKAERQRDRRPRRRRMDPGRGRVRGLVVVMPRLRMDLRRNRQRNRLRCRRRGRRRRRGFQRASFDASRRRSSGRDARSGPLPLAAMQPSFPVFPRASCDPSYPTRRKLTWP